MCKIVLIKKYTNLCFFWKNLLRKNKLPNLSVDEVLSRYDGFEGELCYSFSITEDASHLREMTKKFLEIHKKENLLFLYIASDNKKIPEILEHNFLQIGYDFGVCDSEHTVYSSTFNEILFGSIEELISYNVFLNQHLIFQNKTSIESYAKLHHQLLLEGKDLEDDEEMNIYEIWKYKGV